MKKILMAMFAIYLIILSCTNVLADDIDDEVFIYENTENVGSNVESTIKEPKILSRSAVVFDRTSKTVIWGKKQDLVVPMASTTKIMTGIVVLENANLSDVVTISKKAGGIEGSSAGLTANDKVSVNDLLYGLMLPSGNDAAVALAEHVGGSVEGFAEMMNNKAKEMKLENSSFVTPHGLDMDNHFTTAYELAVMTDYALNIPKFKEVVNTKNYTINISGNPRNLTNTNELLGYVEGADGVKTGFTNGARKVLGFVCFKR